MWGGGGDDDDDAEGDAGDDDDDGDDYDDDEDTERDSDDNRVYCCPGFLWTPTSVQHSASFALRFAGAGSGFSGCTEHAL